jgi:5-methylcytosine-specific restriction endonuclease McrA
MHKYASDRKHRKKRNALQRHRRQTNPTVRAKWLAQLAQYAKDHPDKVCAYVGKRRALKLRATPSWLTQEHLDQIQALYAEAARLTRETGIPHEVDHIIPLKGKTVCGLHVPENLQILTKAENQSKGNRLPAA